MSGATQPPEILTEADLRRGGLVPVAAWRFTEGARLSAAAQRKQAQRERQRQAGLRQFNRAVTASTFELLDAVARAAGDRERKNGERTGDGGGEVLAAIAPLDFAAVLADPELIAAGRRVRDLRGWRRGLARLLGLIED